MGILTPSDRRNGRAYSGTERSLGDAVRHAANEFIESPVDGTRKTRWQAVVDRQFSVAIYGESDKDANSAAKFIRDTLFGRPAVQKQDKASDIPAIIFAERGDELSEIMRKAAEADAGQDGGMAVGIRFDDGGEMLV